MITGVSGAHGIGSRGNVGHLPARPEPSHDDPELIIPPRIELAQALDFAEAKIKEFFGVGHREGGFDALLDPLR